MEKDIRYKSQCYQSKASILEHSRGVVADIWESACEVGRHIPLVIAVVVSVIGFPVVVPLLAIHRRQLARRAVSAWEQQVEESSNVSRQADTVRVSESVAAEAERETEGQISVEG